MEIREDSKKEIVWIDRLGKEPQFSKNLQEIFCKVKHGDISFHTVLSFERGLVNYDIADLSLITLLRLLKTLKDRELNLVLCNLNPEIKKALSELGVEELFVVVECENEARGVLDSKS